MCVANVDCEPVTRTRNVSHSSMSRCCHCLFKTHRVAMELQAAPFIQVLHIDANPLSRPVPLDPDARSVAHPSRALPIPVRSSSQRQVWT